MKALCLVPLQTIIMEIKKMKDDNYFKDVMVVLTLVLIASIIVIGVKALGGL